MVKGKRVSRDSKRGPVVARKTGRGSEGSGPYKTKLEYNRRGVPRERDLSAIPNPAEIPSGGVPRGTSKGGGEKWVKMAGAMEGALDELRTFYATLQRAREVSGGGQIVLSQGDAQAMLDLIAASASILSHGLKAR